MRHALALVPQQKLGNSPSEFAAPVREAPCACADLAMSSKRRVTCCRCDNITISPALLGQLEACKDPLPRKLWPKMGGCSEPHLDLHAEKKDLFDKMHGEDQMAVDKLKEGIEGGSCC